MKADGEKLGVDAQTLMPARAAEAVGELLVVHAQQVLHGRVAVVSLGLVFDGVVAHLVRRAKGRASPPPPRPRATGLKPKGLWSRPSLRCEKGVRVEAAASHSLPPKTSGILSTALRVVSASMWV